MERTPRLASSSSQFILLGHGYMAVRVILREFISMSDVSEQGGASVEASHLMPHLDVLSHIREGESLSALNEQCGEPSVEHVSKMCVNCLCEDVAGQSLAAWGTGCSACFCSVWCCKHHTVFKSARASPGSRLDYVWCSQFVGMGTLACRFQRTLLEYS